jgi:Coenzyme PQQ synthesis protein D (PqqD)
MQTSPECLKQTPSPDQACPSLPPPGACPKRRPDLTSRLVDGEALVLDRRAGLIHQLNHTASFVWERCDGRSTLADIAHQLVHAFEVDPNVAARDVSAMVMHLQELHLLA